MNAPSREKVLRALFWKLLFRGRTAQQAAANRTGKSIGLGLTLALYALLGALPGMAAFFFPPFAFATSLHVITLVYASLTMASTIGTMLFVREEAEILLHRPVRPEEVLRAKCAVLIAFALFSAAALNLVGMFTCYGNRGNAWWFPVAHACSTALLMLFSTSAVVLVYNACLRWLGRERFENLLTLTQVMVGVAMIGGAQIVPRLLDDKAFTALTPASAWAYVLPPLWFGAVDVLLCGAAPFADAWPPAAIGLGLTALLTWLAFVKLAASYGKGLMNLSEAAGAVVDRAHRRWLGALTRVPPLRWWLRDPLERHAFLLTCAYLVRDRETKLKVYPAMAPMLVIPVAMGFGRHSADAGGHEYACVFPLVFAAMQPLGLMALLSRSEQWRASDLFRLAPVRHWTPLFHGARKAVLTCFAIPGLAAVVLVLGLLRGSAVPLFVAVPMLWIMIVSSHVPALFRAWLPLSQPNSDAFDMNAGCLLNGVMMLVAIAVSGLTAWLYATAWYWPFVALLGVLGLSLQAVFLAMMRERAWRVPRR